MTTAECITSITLDERSILSRAPQIEEERAAAITDLLAANHFSPRELAAGPYEVFLSVRDNRLLFDISSQTMPEPRLEVVPVTPLRRVIKDYFLICESYFEAVKSANTYKIEAIDMGRRGVHNEGSEMLKHMLAERIAMDFDTARRLFTLICVLHLKA